MSFRPGTSRPVAHTLHLMARARVAGTAPGYARQDDRLRKAAKVRPPGDTEGIVGSYVRDALRTTHDPAPDATWFARRWEEGEREAMGAHAQRLATEASALFHGSLLPAGGVEILVSPAAGPFAVASSEPWRVVMPPNAPAAAAVLAAVAERLRPIVDFSLLSPEEAERARQHLAGAALVQAAGGPESFEPHLPFFAEAALPSAARGADLRDWVIRVAERALDQPPGEVTRIAGGFSRRMPSRLLRAWRRAFFAPPGFDLASWADREVERSTA